MPPSLPSISEIDLEVWSSARGPYSRDGGKRVNFKKTST